LCDKVPGGIVKRIRTIKVYGKVAVETTVELVSYRNGH
jgi:hypothetical protein